MSGALIGLIPAGLGIAHLVFSRVSSRRPASPLAVARSSAPAYRVPYRPAGAGLTVQSLDLDNLDRTDKDSIAFRVD